MNKPQILFVEDDTAVGNLIATTLETQNYQFHRAKTGAGALMDALSYRPDVMLLDLGLPDMDGIEIIKKIRSWSNLPIIVVSARGEDADKVVALDAGADDYLTKPFSVEELLARIRVALRRVRYDSQKTSAEAALYENGDLKIDYAGGRACCRGAEMKLTPMEYKLLCLLAKNTGKVLTHNYIISEIWGVSAGEAVAEIPSLRVFMATLRKKLELDPSHPQYIQTHVGVPDDSAEAGGRELTVPPQQSAAVLFWHGGAFDIFWRYRQKGGKNRGKICGILILDRNSYGHTNYFCATITSAIQT